MNASILVRLRRLEGGRGEWPDHIMFSAVPLGDTPQEERATLAQAEAEGRARRTPHGIFIEAPSLTVEEWSQQVAARYRGGDPS